MWSRGRECVVLIPEETWKNRRVICIRGCLWWVVTQTKESGVSCIHPQISLKDQRELWEKHADHNSLCARQILHCWSIVKSDMNTEDDSTLPSSSKDEQLAGVPSHPGASKAADVSSRGRLLHSHEVSGKTNSLLSARVACTCACQSFTNHGVQGPKFFKKIAYGARSMVLRVWPVQKQLLRSGMSSSEIKIMDFLGGLEVQNLSSTQAHGHFNRNWNCFELSPGRMNGHHKCPTSDTFKIHDLSLYTVIFRVGF